MNYDEELEYLRKEFKKSEAKFHEAEREGWHTDSNIYEDNMANLGYQIHIHEQAAKADEYEAKAKAFDEVSFIFVDSIAHDYDDHSIVQNIARVIEKEKGDYYV